MVIRFAAAILLFAIASPSSALAEFVPLFDIIVPGAINYRTSNNSIGQTDGGFGWLVARSDILTVADLQNATFTGALNDPAITRVDQGFLSIQDCAPILPGEAAGSRFSDDDYSPLLNSEESLKTPTGGNLNASFFSLGFRFPTSTTYRGSTFDFEGSLTIRGYTANYSTAVTISRASASSTSLVTNPQRISAVPEPSCFALFAIGVIAAGLTRRVRIQAT